MAEKSFSLKDDLFNLETIGRLVKCIKRVYPDFEDQAYLAHMMKAMPDQELKERMSYITSLFEQYLPQDFYEATAILRQSLIGEEEEGHFVFGGHLEYVQKHGCTDERVDDALSLVGEMTQYFSAEFAIRDFINLYPSKSLDSMLKWSKSDNYHKRRLASEGFRPKLPWAKGIDFDYKQAMLPLENLYMDSERYVTRSVANHLNDISKIDPELVVATLKRWKDTGHQEDKEMDYMIHHSLRTLIKRGHLDSLALIGYKANPEIVIKDCVTSTPSIHVGESLVFEFTIRAKESCNLMVDYIVDHPMAKGKRSEKVFKIKKLKMKKDDEVLVTKVHPFRIMTTKKLYAGSYDVTLQINGQRFDTFSFNMTI